MLPGPPTLYQTLLADPAAGGARPLVAAARRDRCRRGAGRAGPGHGGRARLRHGAHRLRADRVLRHGDHVPAQRPARGRSPPPPAGPSRGSRSEPSSDGEAVPTGEPGRDRRARLHRHVRVLGRRGGHGRGHRRRRLAAHRRHRRDGRGRQRDHHRPGQGHVRGRRLQRLPGRDRGHPARHAGVAQVAVVGVPDERMGEVGCAYVVPAAGAGGRRPNPDELARSVLSWSRDAMANYKVPRGVVLVDVSAGQRQREGAQARAARAPRRRGTTTS